MAAGADTQVGGPHHHTGRHLGNFPQAFSHLALIEAAARIIAAERQAEFS